MFDYTGFSERKLARLCSRSFACKPLCKIPYWSSEIHSIGRYLKEYAGIPEWISLFVYSQHGANYDLQRDEHEIDNDAEAMLVFNTDMLELYTRESSKPCYQITMPYVLHRRLHNIVQSPGARGTLVFPVHSTVQIDVEFDMDAYAEQLRALPPEFHPLCISVHMADVRKGLHLEFIKRGFPVYTSGNIEDVFFADRMYSLMRQFKYTASNAVGSHTYYSVEMGIPFSLFGGNFECTHVRTFHVGNTTVLPQGRIDWFDRPSYRKEFDVFSGIRTLIPREQKEWVDHVLGIGTGLSSAELRQLLLDAYRKRRGNAARNALRIAKRKLKRSLVRLAAKCADRIAP